MKDSLVSYKRISAIAVMRFFFDAVMFDIRLTPFY